MTINQNMNPASESKALLVRLVSAFTKHTDKIVVDTIETEGSILHTITVDQEDYHKVVGKDGQRIKALVGIFEFIGFKKGIPIRLILNQCPRLETITKESFVENIKWNHSNVACIIRDLLGAVGTYGAIDSVNTSIATTITLKLHKSAYNDLNSNSYFIAWLIVIMIAIGRKERRIIYLDAISD